MRRGARAKGSPSAFWARYARDVPLRLAVLTDLPTPYRAPLFDLLTRRGVVVPHVLYLARTETLREAWSVDCSGHAHEVLRGRTMTLRGPKGPFVMKWARGAARRLDAIAPDAVLVSGWAHLAMHAASRWAARRGVPSLVVSESHPRPARARWRGALRDAVAGPLVRRAGAWLPVSSRAQALLVHLGADPTRCFLVPNAPDAARFAAARADAAARAATRAALGAGSAPVTVFVGRLIPAKAVDVLLDAAAKATARPTLWVAGGGPLERALASQARALGLADRVRFLGAQPYARVVALCAAADVIAMPSVHEPYGVALHEGMAAGCAALASDAVGAAHDLVEPGREGLRVPAGDADALARAWDTLLADAGRLAAMGAAAAASAQARSIPFAAAQVEAAAAAAVASRPPGVGVVPSGR